MPDDTKPRTAPETLTANAPSDPRGWIFDMKRFAVHDGPGVRTTVFLKGCSLHCTWCHNPEAINPKPEVLVHPERCIGCGTCFEVCPNGAHNVAETGERRYDRNLCEVCGRCVEACYAEALVMAGRKVSVDDVMSVVREDVAFYETSGGGVTLSGGEPLVQGEFATAVLRQCKAEGFHTALDTCGQANWGVIKKVLPYVDLVLYDLKHNSPRQHKKYTGTSNQRILGNLRRICDYGVPVEVRMLIVPTINDSRKVIESAAEFLSPLDNITAIRLLAYHRLAGSKYQSLGLENSMPDVPSPDTSQMQQIASWLTRHGLNVVVP